MNKDNLRYDRMLSYDQRILTGSFYTPDPIAQLMCLMALSSTLQSHGIVDSSIHFKNFNLEYKLTKEKAHRVYDRLVTLKVADICSGTGAFPLAFFRVIHNWLKFQNFSETQTSHCLTQVIQNFTVIDVQSEPLAVYCQEVNKHYGIKAQNVPAYHLDALYDELLLHDDNLLKDLEKGFDIVLGNPPYLGEKSHKAIFQKLRTYTFGSKYYEGRMDYFYYFLYRSLEILKPGGYLCYITTNYFATADGAKKLRAFLKENGSFKAVVNFNDAILFKDAMGQHNAAYVFQNSVRDNTMTLYYPKRKTSSLEALIRTISMDDFEPDWHVETIQCKEQYNEQGHIRFVPLEDHETLLNKISVGSNDENKAIERLKLGDAFHVQQGIVSGFDKTKSGGVFVLSNAELESLEKLAPYVKAFYKNKQVRRYRVLKPANYGILYLDGKSSHLPEVIENHLRPHKERLSRRREVEKGIRPWYALQWPRESWRFEGPLIATPQRAFVNVFAYEPNELYGSADIYYISAKERDARREAHTLFMTGYLNSIIVFYWLHLKGKRKGSMLELYATPLKEVPILDFYQNLDENLSIVSQVKDMITLVSKPCLTQDEHLELHELQKALDFSFAQRLGLTDKDLEHMYAYKLNSGAESHEDAYWEVDTL